MTENPFFHRGPIRDPDYFYNRSKEVKRVLEMLGKGQSVSVIGPRKIGKTSLLFNISQPQVMRRHGLDLSHHLFVYFNCEGLSNLDREALYVLILEEIVEKAAQQGFNFVVPEHPDSHISFERARGEILNNTDTSHYCSMILYAVKRWRTFYRPTRSSFQRPASVHCYKGKPCH